MPNISCGGPGAGKSQGTLEALLVTGVYGQLESDVVYAVSMEIYLRLIQVAVIPSIFI